MSRYTLALVTSVTLDASTQSIHHGLAFGRESVLHARDARGRGAAPGEQGAPRLHRRIGTHAVASVCRQLTEGVGHMPEIRTLMYLLLGHDS